MSKFNVPVFNLSLSTTACHAQLENWSYLPIQTTTRKQPQPSRIRYRQNSINNCNYIVEKHPDKFNPVVDFKSTLAMAELRSIAQILSQSINQEINRPVC